MSRSGSLLCMKTVSPSCSVVATKVLPTTKLWLDAQSRPPLLFSSPLLLSSSCHCHSRTASASKNLLQPSTHGAASSLGPPSRCLLLLLRISSTSNKLGALSARPVSTGAALARTIPRFACCSITLVRPAGWRHGSIAILAALRCVHQATRSTRPARSGRWIERLGPRDMYTHVQCLQGDDASPLNALHPRPADPLRSMGQQACGGFSRRGCMENASDGAF